MISLLDFYFLSLYWIDWFSDDFFLQLVNYHDKANQLGRTWGLQLEPVVCY